MFLYDFFGHLPGFNLGERISKTTLKYNVPISYHSMLFHIIWSSQTYCILTSGVFLTLTLYDVTATPHFFVEISFS